MKITFFGVGYVGLVSGVCLADIGHEVCLVGRDPKKIDNLKKGILPIYEPGLDKLILKNKKRLIFTTDPKVAIEFADILFIAVGTPSKKSGACDLSQVEEVSKSIGKFINNEKIIVLKSTVPVGSEEIVGKIISKHTNKKFTLVSNPEFLKEGTAIDDFMIPDRIVIGSDDKKSLETIEELYKPIKTEIYKTDIKSAQLIKYASNSFLATKISFINEIANLAERVGANVESVAIGMGLDKRIGSQFLKAGLGYGGSCFPKDVKELMSTSKSNGYTLKILDAVDDVNKKQKVLAVKKLEKKIKIEGAKIAILGLSFKPETDDMRDAPSLEIIRELLKKGAKINAFDPIAKDNCKKIIPEAKYFDDIYETVKSVDAVIFVTEWKEIKKIDLKKLKELVKKPIIIDGRNIFNPEEMRDLGFDYQSIGRI
ncbi:MAG: UDP-glucose/GDP-mannose dehydrogenase family protein [Candidatus Daviesbacteria bacterium]|nr:UDP-glucose/GDP-mannose dehydrogenase family protein [Candidatus Daviesbacteria bacterium]